MLAPGYNVSIDMGGASGEITQLIRLAESGDCDARARLFDLLYSDLRKLAAARMRAERANHTLSATALVHEAYLKLVSGAASNCKDRAHFLAVAAQAMRRILVDHARSRLAQKRRLEIDPLDPEMAGAITGSWNQDAEIVAVDEALAALSSVSPRQTQVIELRYFAGLSEDEVAEVLRVSRRTVNRDWRIARAWLHARLSSGAPDDRFAMVPAGAPVRVGHGQECCHAAGASPRM
jgi:RNA polymerase sigma-70 factor, ECF subfamily